MQKYVYAEYVLESQNEGLNENALGSQSLSYPISQMMTSRVVWLQALSAAV